MLPFPSWLLQSWFCNTGGFRPGLLLGGASLGVVGAAERLRNSLSCHAFARRKISSETCPICDPTSKPTPLRSAFSSQSCLHAQIHKEMKIRLGEADYAHLCSSSYKTPKRGVLDCAVAVTAISMTTFLCLTAQSCGNWSSTAPAKAYLSQASPHKCTSSFLPSLAALFGGSFSGCTLMNSGQYGGKNLQIFNNARGANETCRPASAHFLKSTQTKGLLSPFFVFWRSLPASSRVAAIGGQAYKRCNNEQVKEEACDRYEPLQGSCS